MRPARTALTLVAMWLAFGAAARADDVTVFLSADEAMKLAFPDATRFDVSTVPLSEEIRAKVGERMGEPLEMQTIELRRAFASDGGGERLVGRGVLNDDVGKYRPITYMVAVDPHGKVVRVELLVYRESHGGQVRGRSFLEQYQGKSSSDPIHVGKDVTAISGATLSARAVSKGVKRTLLLLEALDSVATAAPVATPGTVP